MKKGDWIETPRFLWVQITDVLTYKEAREQGFSEPTHYRNEQYHILGKNVATNMMIFAAVKRE